MSFADTPASFRQFTQGMRVLSMRDCTRDSNFDLVKVILKCFAPVASAVIKGRLISVCMVEESSTLAFSAASLSLCKANLSLLRSMLSDFLNSLTR
ncbi:Os09g0491780 [Oryza sativa Japonica Group]|uniref:Os09g0491780 protein n=1 Tax=Oryza sativa subsp. japonica TaxID=39947 RepID=A0A0P0XNL3_ORYSJ|nr:hypothetical protein EE612_048674 [Oryza sativa]BAT08749.1 Os09g0491780 [Oryza sativa Japonica Group]